MLMCVFLAGACVCMCARASRFATNDTNASTVYYPVSSMACTGGVVAELTSSSLADCAAACDLQGPGACVASVDTLIAVFRHLHPKHHHTVSPQQTRQMKQHLPPKRLRCRPTATSIRTLVRACSGFYSLACRQLRRFQYGERRVRRGRRVSVHRHVHSRRTWRV